MKVAKEEHEFGSSYYLSQDEKYLKIMYGGNLDLYWLFINKETRNENSTPAKTIYETMLITKENYAIYSLFENLMKEAKTGEIYKPEEIIPEPTWDDEFDVRDVYDLGPFPYIDDEDIKSLTEAYKVSKAKQVNQRITSSHTYKMLYQDNTITWHSDDGSLETAEVLRISEIDEGYLLEFTRPNIKEEQTTKHLPGTISIRFSNSGSRYGDLVTLFTRMYNKLSEYEPDYHQIHIEELEYQKKLKKKDK